MQVGRVGRPHGLDGAFVVEQGSDDPARYALGAELIVGGRPAKIVVSRRVGRGRHAVRLDRTVERGEALMVRRSQLPPLSEDEYYAFDLIGLRVEEVGGRPCGTVKDLLPGPANDNLELDTGVLVPMIEDAIHSIDREEGVVLLNPGFIV